MSSPSMAEASPQALARHPRPGDRLQVRIARLDGDGAGVADLVVGVPPSVSRWLLHVPHALPGELVGVVCVRAGRHRADARLAEVLSAHPARVTPRCRHAGPYDGAARGCGGCSLQHLTVADQLDFKRDRLAKLLAPLRLPEGVVAAPVAVEPSWGGRTKMEYSFGDDAGRRPSLGLHPSGFRWEVIDIDECALVPPGVTPYLRAAAAWRVEAGHAVWDARRGSGVLRALGVRIGAAGLGLELVTAAGAEREHEDVAQGWRAAMQAVMAAPDLPLASLWWTEVRVARGTPTQVTCQSLEGPLHWTHHVPLRGRRALELLLHPLAFFQPHSGGAAAIYGAVRAHVAALRPRRLLDLYCGAGGIGLAVADLVEELIGVERSAEAVAMARANAASNGAGRARYIVGDVAAALTTLGEGAEARVDVTVVDPPRAGLGRPAIERIDAVTADALLYISCNPVTWVADAHTLVELGWAVQSLTPVDQFPHGPHLECVTMLRRLPSRDTSDEAPR